jgi:pyruvate/2-oxoglutarate dehydrogenase complex dihydrolipoamide dehydrogenase (E3) component
VMTRVQALVDAVHAKKDLLGHLAQAEVTVLAGVGAARFVDPHSVALPDGTTLQADKIIICVGGHARRPPFEGGELALTNSDVWSMQQLPRRLAVVGGSATGCQLASVFAAFGAEVTLLELAPRLIPNEDASVSQAIAQAFTRHGIVVHTGIKGVERLTRGEQGLHLHYTADNQTHTLDVDATIVAAGWPGNVAALNLEAAGVRAQRGYIVINDQLQTSVPHIFAAGDITGHMMLVQTGGADARIAAENALRGTDRKHNHRVVPHGGFTDPEYGSVGLTEAQAREQHDVVVATVPYGDIDRAVIDGLTTGFCKLIVERNQRTILGAHIVGEQAVEIAQLVAASMIADAPIERLAELELAYPTYTAIVGLAARQITREIGIVPVAPEWRSLIPQRPAEWERSLDKQAVGE